MIKNDYIQNKYKIIKHIQNRVYKAVNIFDNFQCILKFGKKQYFILVQLEDQLIGSQGIPKIINYYIQNDQNFFITRVLGQNLSDLFKYCNFKFGIKTVCNIGINLLNILQYIHQKGIVHRNIRPENIMTGQGKYNKKIYLIDFSSATHYIKKKIHFNYRDQQNNKFNYQFCSINTHMGIQYSRKDDIQSLIYLLIYFLKGILPWSSIKQGKQNKNLKILEKKLQLTEKELCKGIPKIFQKLLITIKEINLYQKPNYEYYKVKLKQQMQKEKQVQINYYDWQKKRFIGQFK